MNYLQFIETMRADIVENTESAIESAPAAEDEEAVQRYQETIEEAVLAGDLIKLVEVFCRAGWCRQDIVHYLISTLIDDYTDPIVKDQVDQLTCWDPTMHMDS